MKNAIGLRQGLGTWIASGATRNVLFLDLDGDSKGIQLTIH